MVAHLRDGAGPGGEGVAHHAQLVELMHERLLAEEMFLVLERGDHHRRVVEVGRVHNDGVEITDLVGEALAVILHRPRLGELLLHLVQLAGIHVAEAGPLDLRVVLEAVALQPTDAADTNLINAQLAVRVCLRARGGRERGEAGGEHRAGAEERAAGDGGHEGGRFFGVHDVLAEILN